MNENIKDHDLRLLPPEPFEFDEVRLEIAPIRDATLPAENPPGHRDWFEARKILLYHVCEGVYEDEDPDTTRRCVQVDLDVDLDADKFCELFDEFPTYGVCDDPYRADAVESLVEDLLFDADFIKPRKQA